MRNLIKSIFVILTLAGCSTKQDESKNEQIHIESDSTSNVKDTVLVNAINGSLSFNQIPSTPHTVVLTGMPEHRLVTVYKSKREHHASVDYSISSSKRYDDSSPREYEEHYMPGIDLIYGYNLVNIAHYDLTNQKLNFLFDHPVLIKSLYYPSFIQDSLYKKPINRNYYLVSVYDSDTNKDTLINKIDLRRFYYFNASCNSKIQLIPPGYSVVRSQYDPRNDVMYVFARQDINNNGVIDKNEPLHIFWFSLKQPAETKLLY